MNLLRRMWRRGFSKTVVPQSAAAELSPHPGRLFPDYSQRNDLQMVPVSDEVRLEVFWKDLAHGKGPAVSLFILEEEILRIDCFGSERPHLHASFFMPAEGESRLFMPEATVEAQIERAKFELCRNFGYYQARVLNEKIRQVQLAPAVMTESAERAASIMRGFAEKVFSEADMQSDRKA
jgi:hypothetical protein